MKVIPFENNGETKKISIKEFIARIWPYGKWNVIFHHPIDGEYLGKKPVSKVEALNTHIMFKHVISKRVVRIKKVGGFLNGIEYEPREGREKRETNAF